MPAKVVSSNRDGRSAEDAALELIEDEDAWFVEAQRLHKLGQELVGHLEKYAAEPPSPSSVYLMFNPSGVLLYVGITRNAPGRITQHAADKPWYQDIAETRFEHYGSRKVAAVREMWLIDGLRPRHNIARSNPFKDSPRAAKVWDELLECGGLPAWPYLDGFTLPPRREREATSAYEATVHGLIAAELHTARRTGRVLAAAREIAKLVQAHPGYCIHIDEAYETVDDFRVVVDAGAAMVSDGELSPVVRIGDYFMSRRRYLDAKRVA